MAVTQGAEALRDEMLVLLLSMGVKLPASTKLPLSALEERLANALDRAQRYAVLGGDKTELKLGKFAPWRKGESLASAMRESSLEERVTGNFNATPFGQLRHTLSDSISLFYEQRGETKFFLEDPARNRSIKIVVDRVLAISEKIPLLEVRYKCGTVEDDDEEGVKLIHDPGMHTLMVKLLELNSTHLPEPKQGPKENEPMSSFLLPIGPLTMKDIGSLTKDVGCIVCGRTVVSKCSSCQTVSYCGKECQRTDWKRHKPACRSLETGTWHTFSFSATFGGMFVSHFSRTDRSFDDAKSSNPGAVKPNVHGTNPFLVKVQITSNGGMSMLIYDRQRSFDAHYLRAEDPTGFERLAQVVYTGYMGLKIYLWAKRVGDQRLSICLDRKPDQAGISW
ncbi:hypothetical protein BOTBODRAFT_142402 [Botryobasidium botryosum FD-172 SS1]|uniref:MYND-type domain-containing protein n=1 Tax=Botryobasidium botryosum (strain FD-172 SS1) TaxID=930990 RepID=A0A067N244_BOTB1|nr:hypothetical protein BOTBODRAFT_142402 [Botryobasidium botryosum FD-172 SS1]